MAPARSGNATRYGSTAHFDAGTSYQRVAVDSNDVYYAGAFDGTRIYMPPFQVLSPSAPLGLLQAYDTSKAFTAFASFDLLADAGVDPNAGAFGGAVFDSRY